MADMTPGLPFISGNSGLAAGMDPEVADWVARTDPKLIGRSEITSETTPRKAFQAVLEMFRAGRLTEAQIHQDEGLTAGSGIRHRECPKVSFGRTGQRPRRRPCIRHKDCKKNNFSKILAGLANMPSIPLFLYQLAPTPLILLLNWGMRRVSERLNLWLMEVPKTCGTT